MKLQLRTFFIFLFLFFTGFINAQTFQWANSIKSEGFDEGYDLVTDPVGNTYVAGMMEFNTDFGNGVILTSAGIHDIFLAKYNPTGRLVWAKRAGGIGGDKIQSITLDGQGHIFVAGEFEDTCYWDTIMKSTNGPLGVNNMFVAKYDTSGPVIWVRNIGVAGPLQTRGYGVTCDELGNVYACGGSKGDTYYDGTFLFTTAGDYDGTIVSFDPAGNFRWARRLGGIDSDKAYGIVSDKNGYIYVTGYFAGTADFSPSVTLHGTGHTDIFLAKYDATGLLQWVRQAGDTGFERGWDVTINVNGQIIITGEAQTSRFGTNMMYSRGNEDMFLASYDSNGNNLWVISGGGPEDDIGRGVSHDSSGNILVIGDYASTGVFTPDTVYSNGYADIFVASYKSDGSSLNWVRSVGGLDNDRGRGVGTDLAGNVNVCGEFVDSARFDATDLMGDTLLDVFVARLIQGNFCSAMVSITAQNTCNGMCDGIALANATGQGPFTYNWSTVPSQTGAIVSNLCEGTYTVISTDAVGCSATAFVTLIDPPLLQPSAASTDATCAGLCDGTAIASATGQGPFTFNWQTSPPQTGPTATGLCQGAYTVIATDVAGCTATTLATLTDPLPLQLTGAVTNTTCIGCSDGGINLTVNGGTINYQYSWSDGNTNEDRQNLMAGVFTVCVADLNGCNLCDTFTVMDPTSGIDITNSNHGYSIFPNPFSTSTTIHLTIPAGVTTKVVIYTPTGEVVYKSEFRGNDFNLPANNLSAGVYYMQLSNDYFNGKMMIPLMLEK